MFTNDLLFAFNFSRSSLWPPRRPGQPKPSLPGRVDRGRQARVLRDGERDEPLDGQVRAGLRAEEPRVAARQHVLHGRGHQRESRRLRQGRGQAQLRIR